MNTLGFQSIIIVHRNLNYLNQLDHLLRQQNYLIKGISNSGIEALRYILTKEPDIAILQFELSHLNALDIIKIVTKKELKTKFIVIYYKNDREYISQLPFKRASKSFLIRNTLEEIELFIKKISKVYGH